MYFHFLFYLTFKRIEKTFNQLVFNSVMSTVQKNKKNTSVNGVISQLFERALQSQPIISFTISLPDDRPFRPFIPMHHHDQLVQSAFERLSFLTNDVITSMIPAYEPHAIDPLSFNHFFSCRVCRRNSFVCLQLSQWFSCVTYSKPPSILSSLIKHNRSACV